MELRRANGTVFYGANDGALPDSFYGKALENTPEEQNAARRYTAAKATDEADEAFLLGLLGLLAPPPEPLGPVGPPAPTGHCRGPERHPRTVENTGYRDKGGGRMSVFCLDCANRSRKHYRLKQEALDGEVRQPA